MLPCPANSRYPPSVRRGRSASIFLVGLMAIAPCGCTESAPPGAADAGRPFVLEPPPTTPPERLPPVAGASAEGGRALFERLCAPCHGSGGRGDGPEAGKQRIAPTDLAGPAFLCFSTVGKPAAPSDGDLDAALDRGAHRTRPELAALGAAARRSILLHEKTLAAPRPEQPLLAVPAEPADTPDDRARGRALYLAFGCWRCHGAAGAGDGDLVKNLAWNRRALGPTLAPLSAGALCGADPVRRFQTVALGLGAAPAIMPPHLELAELFARPRGDAASWTKPLEGKVSVDDIAAVRALLAALPERKDVLDLPAGARHARGAALVWSIVHWLRSVP